MFILAISFSHLLIMLLSWPAVIEPLKLLEMLHYCNGFCYWEKWKYQTRNWNFVLYMSNHYLYISLPVLQLTKPIEKKVFFVHLWSSMHRHSIVVSTALCLQMVVYPFSPIHILEKSRKARHAFKTCFSLLLLWEYSLYLWMVIVKFQCTNFLSNVCAADPKNFGPVSGNTQSFFFLALSI